MSDRADRILRRLNESDGALWLLFGASFLETIIVPIPIELVLIPFMVANRDRLWRTALVVTAGCLVASVVGYGVGYWLFETMGRWAIDTLGWQSGYEQFQGLFDRYGFWAIVMLGIVPVPFQTAMLAAGAAEYPLHLFVLAATVARGIRYFGLAGLVRAVGERAEALWERHRLLATGALVGVLLLLFGAAQLAGRFLLDGSSG